MRRIDDAAATSRVATFLRTQPGRRCVEITLGQAVRHRELADAAIRAIFLRFVDGYARDPVPAARGVVSGWAWRRTPELLRPQPGTAERAVVWLAQLGIWLGVRPRFQPSPLPSSCYAEMATANESLRSDLRPQSSPTLVYVASSSVRQLVTPLSRLRPAHRRLLVVCDRKGRGRHHASQLRAHRRQ
jgi:hypothetical protein